MWDKLATANRLRGPCAVTVKRSPSYQDYEGERHTSVLGRAGDPAVARWPCVRIEPGDVHVPRRFGGADVVLLSCRRACHFGFGWSGVDLVGGLLLRHIADEGTGAFRRRGGARRRSDHSAPGPGTCRPAVTRRVATDLPYLADRQDGAPGASGDPDPSQQAVVPDLSRRRFVRRTEARFVLWRPRRKRLAGLILLERIRVS